MLKKIKNINKNKRGFAISGLLYPILILTVFLVVQILFMMQTRKNVLDKVRTELSDKINLSNKTYTNEELSMLVDELKNGLIDKTYPIGSIYTSVNNTNPSTLFGGTWVAYGQGRTLVGVDTSQSEFNIAEKNGGTKTFNNAHTHSLSDKGQAAFYGSGINMLYRYVSSPSWPSTHKMTSTTTETTSSSTYSGGIALRGTTDSAQNSAQSLLQPYTTVYMWKRTA